MTSGVLTGGGVADGGPNRRSARFEGSTVMAEAPAGGLAGLSRGIGHARPFVTGRNGQRCEPACTTAMIPG
jgi:hypothetical protein